MKHVMEKMKLWFADEEAVTAIEYALLAALIAVAIIGGASMLGGDISSKFTSIGGVI